MPLGDDNYVKSLQAEIERQRKDTDAMRQELTASGGAEIDKPATVVKKSLIPSVPEYIQNIDNLANSADSESVRLQANKILVEWAVTNKLSLIDDDADGELKQLLSKIMSKKGTS